MLAITSVHTVGGDNSVSAASRAAMLRRSVVFAETSILDTDLRLAFSIFAGLYTFYAVRQYSGDIAYMLDGIQHFMLPEALLDRAGPRAGLSKFANSEYVTGLKDVMSIYSHEHKEESVVMVNTVLFRSAMSIFRRCKQEVRL